MAKKAIPAKKEEGEEVDVGTLGMAPRDPKEVHGWPGDPQEKATNQTLGLLNNTKDSYFETLWREQRADGSYIQNNNGSIIMRDGEQEATPTIALDKAFEDALGLHRADDYFNRLAEQPTVSPRLDQEESLASVAQEDTTCASYLISEASENCPALSKTGTVTGETSVARVSTKHVPVAAVKVEPAKSDSPDDSTSSSPKSLEVTNDSIFRMSSQTRAKMLTQQKQNSRGSSNLVYSPEAAEGESIATTSLYTESPTIVNQTSINKAQVDRQSSMEPSSEIQSVVSENESSPSASTNDMSPVQLMGELVSLNSTKYSSDPSKSPQSEASPSEASSPSEQESPSSVRFAEQECADKSPKLRQNHVRTASLASLASYSSLPIEQDTSAVPFEETGVSAIAEESSSKLQESREIRPSNECSPVPSEGSRLISFTDTDGSDSESATDEATATESEEEPIEEASLEQDDVTEVIVAIKKLPEGEDNESDSESVSSESTLQYGDTLSISSETTVTAPPHDEEEHTIYDASHEVQLVDDKVIVSSKKLPESNGQSISPESSVYTESDMPKTRLQFSSDALVNSPPPPVESPAPSIEKESHLTQETKQVSEYRETVGVSQNTSATVADEAPKVIKAAVATGRVFAPRAPGELLISVDLGTLLPGEEDSESAALDELSQASERTSNADVEAATLDEQPKAINLITNPRALQQEEQARTAAQRGNLAGYHNDDSSEATYYKKETKPVQSAPSNAMAKVKSYASDDISTAVEEQSVATSDSGIVTCTDDADDYASDNSSKALDDDETTTEPTDDASTKVLNDETTTEPTDDGALNKRDKETTEPIEDDSSKALQETTDEAIELVPTMAAADAGGYASDIMTLRPTESPKVLETIDFKPAGTPSIRDASVENQASPVIGHEQTELTEKCSTHEVATMNDEKRAKKTSRPVINLLASASPSADSVASSSKGSPIPLVSEQALSNAAFLFSPSYAGGKTRLLKHANPPREMNLSTYAISTAQSRSRLSTFSARSRPAFSIPISSAPLNMSSIRRSQASYSSDSVTFTLNLSRYSKEDTQFTESRASKESGEEEEKHVHFSGADECHVIREANTSRVALGTPVKVVSPPPIDRKISDLTDMTEATVLNATNNDSDPSLEEEPATDEPSRQRVASILREIEEDDETVEEGDVDDRVERETPKSDDDDEEVVDSSPESAMRWTVGELGAATPLRANGRQGSRMAPTNSPRHRFKEAKNKFNNPVTNVPICTSTMSNYTAPTVSDSGSVSSRVSALNDRLRSNRQPVRKNPRRETGGENALAPRQATLEAPLFRNPIIMSYKDDASQAPSAVVSIDTTKSDTGVSTVVSADLKSDTGVSTVVSDTGVSTVASDTGVSTVASLGDLKSDTGVSLEEEKEPARTVVSTNVSVYEEDDGEDIFTTMMMGSPEEDESDEEEDAFADARRLSDEFDNQKLRKSSTSLQSLLARDEEKRLGQKPPRMSRGPLATSLRSLVSEDPSALTFETDKENSVSVAPRPGSLGPKVLSFNDRAKVNPQLQQCHAPPGELCLSPTKRTPLQARRWRSLAAQAQEKDQAKKGSSKKRGLLKERSSNIMVGN